MSRLLTRAELNLIRERHADGTLPLEPAGRLLGHIAELERLAKVACVSILSDTTTARHSYDAVKALYLAVSPEAADAAKGTT